MLFMGLLLIFSTVVSLYYILFTMLKPNRAVLISTRTKQVYPVLEQILNQYESELKNLQFIEIGAGYARVTAFMAKQKKFKQLTALEINFFVIQYCRMVFALQKLPVRFIRKNILDYKMPKPSFVYSYMSSNILQKLYENKQLEDCILVSLTFAIKGATPSHEYPIQGFQKRIYVYDFRQKN